MCVSPPLIATVFWAAFGVCTCALLSHVVMRYIFNANARTEEGKRNANQVHLFIPGGGPPVLRFLSLLLPTTTIVKFDSATNVERYIIITQLTSLDSLRGVSVLNGLRVRV